MATWSAPAASPNPGLGEDDLKYLHDALYPVRKRYRPLGLQLGLPIREIRAIQQTDPGECLLEILLLRVNKTEPLTWNDIDTALRSEPVGESRIADGIRKKYGHLFSPDPRVECTSDHEQTLDKNDKKKEGRKGRGKRSDRSPKQERKSERQNEDSDGEVRGRGKMKYPEKHESRDESSGLDSGENVKSKEVREKVEEFSVPHESHERECKRKFTTELCTKAKRKKESESHLSEAANNVNVKYFSEKSEKSKKRKEVKTDITMNESRKKESVNSFTDKKKIKIKAKEPADYMTIKEQDDELNVKEASDKQGKARESAEYKKVKLKVGVEEAASHEQGKYSDVGKSALRSESESEDEFFSARSSNEEESKVMHHDNAKWNKKRSSQTLQFAAQESPSSPRSMEVHCSEEMEVNKADKKPDTRGKHSKAPDESKREVKGASEKSSKEQESESDDNGEEQESESDESSEDEKEDRDSEQKSSVEGEETESSYDGSSLTSDAENMKEKHKPYAKGNAKETEKKEGKKGKSVKVKIQVLQQDKDYSDPTDRGRDQGEHGIQPKKKNRRRHRECSPIARGSSSPSTSQEEQNHTLEGQERKKERMKGHKKKRKENIEEKVPSSFKMDDSSPECDMTSNPTIDKSTKLRKIFKRFFGKLCCAIVNPVETAAQLQEKRLISHSLMKNLILSPESLQVKTISLVDALHDKIKVHPDCLFLFIELLLDSEVPKLQKTGGEMLREAGRVCPETTTARFTGQLPSSTTVASSSDGLPQANKTTSNTGGTSQGVSQSVRQSVGLSPVLAKYKQYLQSVYNARVLAPADKYLPTLEAPYINLAMIRRERYNTEQRDEFTRQTLHGGVDQILESKKSINIKDLLTPEEGGRPVRFILVEGPPGIGKSTFSWEVCRRWDEIKSLRDYHTVVLLKLTEKWVFNAASLSDLFRYEYDPELSKSVSKELAETQGRNLLLLLDGFDEVSHSFHRNSVVKRILCRKLLPECTIILTTRPVAKATLECICQPRVDKHVEIIGFTEEERVRFITEVFSKEPELQVNFLKYMFLVPRLKSMMYIPLNCAIIAQVYYESQSSHYLITRTQLYKALTHSLLVRHMKMKNSDFEYESMLPEGLDKEHKEMFKGLAKFAFDIYHKGSAAYLSFLCDLFSQNCHETESRKVTFFKKDIPEGLVHFGFMNESTEMYAGKGVERTFSFLHLSLQEYLAAWHLAYSYSIEFQVAYHRLAVDGSQPLYSMHYREDDTNKYYNGDYKEEEGLISSLKDQESSLEEPAIFLAGITGWRCQSESDRNHWEMYLSHDTADVSDTSVLLRSLYEAQNPTLVPLYFASNYRKNVCIGSGVRGLSGTKTPYDCYALSFCLANASEEYGFSLSFAFNCDYDISLVETFVKGLNYHCKSTTPLIVESLQIERSSPPSLVDRGLPWLVRANLLNTKECRLHPTIINSSVAPQFLQTLNNLQSHSVSSVYLDPPLITFWAGTKSLSELKQLHISSSKECSPPPTDIHTWPLEHGLVEEDNKLREVVFHIEFPSNTMYDIYSPTDVLVGSVLKSVLRSNTITKLVLPNISRGTMACVRSILLHCPSLTTLELKKTRLGYDGILYICSALRNNTTLTRLVIYDDLQLPKAFTLQFTTFSSVEGVSLPSKTTPTDFLLELNNILKDNTTLEEMKIQSGLFLPLSVSAGGDLEYYQWTELGPLQQFNVGVVASGMSPNLRRSFSLSDFTQPQTQLFWDRKYSMKRTLHLSYQGGGEVNFKKLFSKRKEKGKKLFSGPSLTAPDTQVLQSFSGLDLRLKECLEISNLHEYVETLRMTYGHMMKAIYRSYSDEKMLKQRLPSPESVLRPSHLLQPTYLQPCGNLHTSSDL